MIKIKCGLTDSARFAMEIRSRALADEDYYLAARAEDVILSIVQSMERVREIEKRRNAKMSG